MKFVSQSYYEILDIDLEASDEEVKRAYRLVRSSFEPDSMAIYSLYSPEETEAIGSKIDEAFRMLTNRDHRRAYDKYLGMVAGRRPCPDDPHRFFDGIHHISELTPLEQFVEGMGEELAAVAPAVAAGASAEYEEVSAEASIDIPAVTAADASLEQVLDGPEAPTASSAIEQAECRLPLEPMTAPTEATPPESDVTLPPIPEALCEEPAPSVSERSQMSFDQASTTFHGLSSPQHSTADVTDSHPRLRSWTRDYTDRRLAERQSICLNPLTEESLGHIREDSLVTGSVLRRIREQRGVELETICEETKISIMYLRFIEADRYDDLPASIYVTGYIEKYVRLLDLPRDVVGRFMRQYQQHIG